jgi:arylsulfatase A-like enzyme
MVSVSDELVGNLTAKLKGLGLWSNTVFVFASDNGGDPTVGGNYPWKGGKATLWEGGVRSAAFVYSELLPSAMHGANLTDMTHISDW